MYRVPAVGRWKRSKSWQAMLAKDCPSQPINHKEHPSQFVTTILTYCPLAFLQRLFVSWVYLMLASVIMKVLRLHLPVRSRSKQTTSGLPSTAYQSSILDKRVAKHRLNKTEYKKWLAEIQMSCREIKRKNQENNWWFESERTRFTKPERDVKETVPAIQVGKIHDWRRSGRAICILSNRTKSHVFHR